MLDPVSMVQQLQHIMQYQVVELGRDRDHAIKWMEPITFIHIIARVVGTIIILYSTSLLLPKQFSSFSTKYLKLPILLLFFAVDRRGISISPHLFLTFAATAFLT